ncbi:MAG: hypothetical protein EOP86_15705 [Verrucomicrobiaceae bacterium]|nr:MAG: hypothetical protein EOP86_15705 [Verrucomicrobiaceae bacterium]
MKNIQIIDGAMNCSYSIYQAQEEDFILIFPAPRQNVEFIDDFIGRVGYDKADQILTPLWSRRLEKEQAQGIHGTLFYEQSFKKQFYPNKSEGDLFLNRSV